MIKYKIVKNYIQDLINSNDIKADEKIPSENQLAKILHVSRNTVRKAILEMVNDGILYTKHGVGTFINSINSKTKNIGIILSYMDDYIFPSVIRGLSDCLSKNSYSIILSQTKNYLDKEEQCLQNMLSKDIEGIIIEPSKSANYPENIALYNKFLDRNIPIILIHGYYQVQDFSFVVMDDQYGGYLATKHLLENNHRNILGVFKSDDIQGINRYYGFLKAMNEFNNPITPNSTIWFQTEDRDKKPSYIIEHIIKSDMDMPTALFCYNDQIAFNIIKVLKQYNIKIPEDISLIGYDDSLLASSLEPQFSSIRHPKSELGKKAAESLLKLINKETNKIQHAFKGELIKRNSVKKI